MYRILVVVCLAIAFQSLAHADTKNIFCKGHNVCSATITGVISESDVVAFNQIAKTIASTPPSEQGLIVFLKSNGGDVKSAIEIGRIIRGLPKSAAIVGSKDACLSACVFVLAGALARDVSGKVGIHRPYSESTQQEDYPKRQQQFTELSRKVKTFLEQMNVPPSLYEEMIRIPPETIEILSPSELSRFGLDRMDPVYQDSLDSDNARSWGLTKGEYLARKVLAANICTDRNPPKTKNFQAVKEAYEREVKCGQDVMAGKRKD